MLKVLLISPRCEGPDAEHKWNSFWPPNLEIQIDKNYWNVFSSGILLLAAIAREYGACVEVVDENYACCEIDDKYDIVAFYTVTPNIKRCIHLSRMFQAKGIYTVFGGVHASLCCEEVKEYADSILIGEGELIWRDFLKDYKAKTVKKIYRQDLGKVILDDSPIPAFDLIPKTRKREIIPIQTARGCPHGCKFCNLHSLYGTGYRVKTLRRVQSEIEEVRQHFKDPMIYFTDDNLFCDKNRSKNFLKMVEQFDLEWIANTDVTFGLNKELIEQAYRAGCRRILIGFESVNKKNLLGLDKTNFKSKNRDKYEEAIFNIQSYGIGVVGSFIVGFEDDTKESFEDIFEFVQNSGLVGINITVNTPYPGTQLYEQLRKEEKILTYDWNQYTIFQLVIKLKYLSYEEFNEEYVKLLLKVYSQQAVTERRRIMINTIRKRRLYVGEKE